jgi:hypothetical protein
MANQYENYLNRLRNIKANRPEMRVYEHNMASLSQPFNILNRKVAQMTQAGGASTAAQVAALNEGRGQWNQMQQHNYGQALDAAGRREGQVDMKIAEVEFQNDQYKEEQRREKAARRSGLLRTVISGIGMAAGAVLAPLTGGASMLAGAALGGAIGQTASGFMGVNKDGNLSLNPDEWDMNTIEQGMMSTVTQLATNANQRAAKNTFGAYSENSGRIMKYINDNPNSATQIMFDIQRLLSGGNEVELREYIDNLFGGE